jgi:FMN phosphatase YigB (HAD superfamily)
MFTSLLPLFAHLPLATRASYSTNQEHTLKLFSIFERELQVSQPSLPYTQLLEKAYLTFASSLSIPVTPAIEEEAKIFGNSILTWPAFPDTVAALKALGKRYKLIILSNTTREAISGTTTGPLEGVQFDAVYTAEEIGSYKPDLRNFDFLLEKVERELGVKKEELLHTAHRYVSLLLTLISIRSILLLRPERNSPRNQNVSRRLGYSSRCLSRSILT